MKKNHATSSLTPQIFQLAVEHSTDHITLSDVEGTVLYANQAVEQMTGFSKEEVIGKKAGAKELWGGLMPKEFYQRLWDQVKNKKKPFQGVIKNKRKDGSIFFVSASIFPVLNDEGEIDFFVEVHRDITREKEIEKSKTDFLSYAGHKLQTPLTVIKWSLELLSGSKLSSHQQKIMNDAVAANENMIELVGDLLDATRIEFGKFSVIPEPVDPSSIMKLALSKVQLHVKEKGLHIHEIYTAPKRIPLDKKILETIFTILVSNAVKFTAQDGEVAISITANQSKEELLITIKDTGIGIRPEDRPKIFTKFFRSRDAQLSDPQGSGIALFNAQQLVTGSGGRIWFESPVKKHAADHTGASGASFFVAFPLSGMIASE